MKKHALLLVVVAFLCLAAKAQITAPSVVIIIPDSTLITSVTHSGDQEIPVFSIPGINSIISQFYITSFKRAMPYSRFPDMRQVWEAFCDYPDSLGQLLNQSYPAYFPHYEAKHPGLCSAYYPNDYNTPYPTGHPDGYLKYINAPDAWGITHGDPQYSDWCN